MNSFYNKKLVFKFYKKLNYFIFRFKSDSKKYEVQRQIYCFGEILHEVQTNRLFKDSKTFVDKKLKYEPEIVLSNFYLLKEKSQGKISVDDLKLFVIDNFEAEHGLEICSPNDWKPEPKFVKNLKDPKLNKFALNVHSLWPSLGRRINNDIRDDPNKYSLLYVPKPFIVPGGRFTEFYYWDSYWIVRGLILSEMFETVRNILENYFILIKEFGFIPNGGRIYYLDRSQPPVISLMVETYIEATNDKEFLCYTVPCLEKEFLFWLENRIINVTYENKIYRLFRYGTSENTPRPESYYEDYNFAQSLSKEKQASFYREVRAATESGHDFSARWWIPEWKEGSSFADINTTSIVPVCLNSLMYRNAKNLAKFNKLLGNKSKIEYYEKIANEILDSIMTVLWQEEIGSFLDYDTINQKCRNHFYPSNFSPLWLNIFANCEKITPKIIHYLEHIELLQHEAGVPASLIKSGHQWDLPNAWAPHQDMVITGLLNLKNDRAKAIAEALAKRWISRNYSVYQLDNVMYEKFDIDLLLTGGSGGEYENQIGFGWTNGVLLDLLNRFSQVQIND